jgi:hypothetical protein
MVVHLLLPVAREGREQQMQVKAPQARIHKLMNYGVRRYVNGVIKSLITLTLTVRLCPWP